MSNLANFFRAVADGLDLAAGRDPVDEHAAQAADVVNGHDPGAIRVGRGRAFWDWGPEMAQLPPAAKVRHLEDMLSAALLDRDKLAEDAKVLAAENRELRRQVDDPDEVVVTADAGDASTVIRLGVAEQELRRFKRMYGRASETIGKLRGERARHQEMFDRTMKGIDRATDALHRDLRAAAERETVLQAKLAEKNSTGRPTVAREDLANELLRAYTGNEESNAGVAIGWGPVADRAVTVLFGTSDAT